MRTLGGRTAHTYRLVLGEDGYGSARTIEFEADTPDAALYLAQQQCNGREAELIEDGRSLGRVQCALNGGFWIISSPISQQLAD